jgi:hypothetical protein
MWSDNATSSRVVVPVAVHWMDPDCHRNNTFLFAGIYSERHTAATDQRFRLEGTDLDSRGDSPSL